MQKLAMPAFQVRICGNALTWLEVGDWVHVPRPELPIAQSELVTLGSRLCMAFWAVARPAKSPDEFREVAKTVLNVELANLELHCIISALEAAMQELPTIRSKWKS